jgi:hypothetical protein
VKLLYLAHPVSGDVRGNIDRALRWLAFLSRAMPENAVAAPWVSNLLAGDDDSDPRQRERGLRNCCAIVSRLDGVILVGGRVSAGMARERVAAEQAGKLVIDLTWMGEEPPGVERVEQGLRELRDAEVTTTDRSFKDALIEVSE